MTGLPFTIPVGLATLALLIAILRPRESQRDRLLRMAQRLHDRKLGRWL